MICKVNLFLLIVVFLFLSGCDYLYIYLSPCDEGPELCLLIKKSGVIGDGSKWVKTKSGNTILIKEPVFKDEIKRVAMDHSDKFNYLYGSELQEPSTFDEIDFISNDQIEKESVVEILHLKKLGVSYTQFRLYLLSKNRDKMLILHGDHD